MSISYLAQTFSQARSCLLPPHPRGIADDVSHACHEMYRGLLNEDQSEFPDHIQEQIKKLEALMDTSTVDTSTAEAIEKGGWRVRATSFSEAEMREFSELVDSLATWFTSNDPYSRGDGS